jgi:WD40 repeat protein
MTNGLEHAINNLKRSLCLFLLAALSSVLLCADLQGPAKPPTVRKIAIDSVGEHIAVYRSDGSFEFLDAASGKSLRNFVKDPHFIQNMVLSSNGHLLATVGLTIIIWSTDSGIQIGELPPNSLVNSIAFSDDGKLLATGDSTGSITIWDLASGKVQRQFAAHHDAIDALAFSHDNHYLAAGSWDKTASIWDVRSGTQTATLKGHTGWVTAISFDATSTHVVTGGFDGLINVWETASGKNIASATNTMAGVPMIVHSVAFSRDGNSIFAVSIGAAGIWSASTGGKVRSFDNLSAQTALIACKADGKHVVVVGTDGSIALIEISTGAVSQLSVVK